MSKEAGYEYYAKLGGAAVATIDRLTLNPGHGLVDLIDLKIKLPAQRHGDFLIVARGTHEDGTPMVAFMSGDSLASCLRKFSAQFEDETLKWRIDEWRIQNDGGNAAGSGSEG